MSVRKNNTKAAPADGGRPSSKVYEIITKTILKSMMDGEIPWRKTFVTRENPHPFTNYITGKPYSLINGLLLGVPGQYATMKQINARGGRVNKGSKSKIVIYWGEYVPKDKQEEAKRLEEEGKDASHLKVRFPKYYQVFNVADTTGLPEKAEEKAPSMVRAEDPTDIADMVVKDYRANEGVDVRTDNASEPAYLAESDTVVLPEKAAFTFEEDFYASLFDQLVHSTAPASRCDRKKEYEKLQERDVTVKEEILADIASSMILAVTGMRRTETHEQIAADCQRYVEAMNRDYRLIVNAASAAEKAAKYILGRFAV